MELSIISFNILCCDGPEGYAIRQRAPRVTGILEERKPDPNFPFYAMYTGDRSNGEKLAEKFRSMGYEIPQERIINVGAAIGSHVGPNACGMVYISE